MSTCVLFVALNIILSAQSCIAVFMKIFTVPPVRYVHNRSSQIWHLTNLSETV